MKVVLSDTWGDAEKLMAEYVNLWTPLKEYKEGDLFCTWNVENSRDLMPIPLHINILIVFFRI